MYSTINICKTHKFNQVQNPYQNLQPLINQQADQLKQLTLTTVEPFVQYGLKESIVTSQQNAMREITAISYLIGRGYDPNTADKIVESREVNEVY